MQIEQVIQENGTYIYNYAMKLTCHPQAAEDLAQQTFITAWIHFSETQSSNQKKIRQAIEKKEYEEKGYHFEEQIRRKITYLYRNMPEKRPSDVWFQKVIDAVS